jgi:cytidine deaminase
MNISELTLQKMKSAARAAAKKAYCPYSKFPVGASVLTEDNKVYSGSNVENASYSLTICAERNAIFQAVSSGRRKIMAVVIVTPTSTPTPPCGACRQVINEFGGKAEIFCFGKNGNMRHYNSDELLPEAFGPDVLLK